MLDKNYQTVFANMRLGEMLGYSQEEMTGKRHRFFLFDEDIGDLEEKQARRRQGMAEHYERMLEEETLLRDMEEQPVCPTCQHKLQPDWML